MVEFLQPCIMRQRKWSAVDDITTASGVALFGDPHNMYVMLKSDLDNREFLCFLPKDNANATDILLIEGIHVHNM